MAPRIASRTYYLIVGWDRANDVEIKGPYGTDTERDDEAYEIYKEEGSGHLLLRLDISLTGSPTVETYTHHELVRASEELPTIDEGETL